MKIAVLGWGSLIWEPRNLKIKNQEWKKDGPKLPVEFARISLDERLTLVLYPGARPVQVLWNYMNVDSLEEAIENLKEREGTSNTNIGFVDLTTNKSRSNVIPEIVDEIRNWIEKKDVDAVIWTDLPSNFESKFGKYNEKNVLSYLEKLEPYKFKKAMEYIIKAPKQINTKMRKVIEEKLLKNY